MPEGRVPLAIKQARCLPGDFVIKLFVFSRLILGSWNLTKGLVTKSYVLSRADLPEGHLRHYTPSPPAVTSPSKRVYFGCRVTLVMLTVPPSVA